ncbi:hypothetical protein V8C42DRAFT_182399 [Trichoderma barbatum]
MLYIKRRLCLSKRLSTAILITDLPRYSIINLSAITSYTCSFSSITNYHSLKMCHGHPRYHSCAHTSLVWYYCPSAHIDLETGFETPCRNVSFAPAQSSPLSCPLKNCQFVDKGGSWICCKCNQGPNTQGWCSTPMANIQDDLDSLQLEDVQRTCDHGCCDDCKRFGTLATLGSKVWCR